MPCQSDLISLHKHAPRRFHMNIAVCIHHNCSFDPQEESKIQLIALQKHILFSIFWSQKQKFTWNFFQNYLFPQNSSIVEMIRALPSGLFEICQTLKVNFFNYIFSDTRKSFTNVFHLEIQSFNYCYLVPNLD